MNEVGAPVLVAWPPVVTALVAGFVLLNAIVLAVTYVTLLERKFAARLQSRIGPYRVGPHGLLQPIADAVKLMMKEDIIPRAADRRVFNLAPIVFLIPCMLIFATIPFAPGLGVADLNIGILFFLAVSSMEIVGLFMAGWGSNNKYALISVMRAVNQIISYDLPFIFAALVPVLLAGSLRLSDIAIAQAGLWFVFYPVLGQLAFLAFVIASVAAENRVPFDILEAESELVAGFRVEYLGDEVRPDPARRVRPCPRDVVPRRAALPGRLVRPGPGLARAGLVPAQGAPLLPPAHVGALELRPHPRRPDPGDLLEAAAAGDAAAGGRHGSGRRLEVLTCKPKGSGERRAS